MWQRVRDYWVPWLLFVGVTTISASLLLLVVAMPMVIQYASVNSLLELFAHDATVRRSSIAGAIGLIVTAFVFFRPSASPRKSATAKKPPDPLAGA